MVAIIIVQGFVCLLLITEVANSCYVKKLIDARFQDKKLKSCQIIWMPYLCNYGLLKIYWLSSAENLIWKINELW